MPDREPVDALIARCAEPVRRPAVTTGDPIAAEYQCGARQRIADRSTAEALPAVVEMDAEESERVALQFALRDARHDAEHLTAAVERADEGWKTALRDVESLTADRDRLAAQLAEIRRIVTSVPLPLPPSSDVAYFHWMLGQHETAGKVLNELDPAADVLAQQAGKDGA